MSKNLHEYRKHYALRNYIDSDVRMFARMHELSPSETWELRVTTLATMLARTLSETESNDSDFKIMVDPVGNCWTGRLIRLMEERCRTMSQEEFMSRHGG